MTGVEVLAALAVGALVLWLVFAPALLVDRRVPLPDEPELPEETRHGVALLALKEIEFDRETGKLSDADYHQLKSRYAAEALAALGAHEARPAAAGDDPELLITARLAQLRSARAAGLPTAPFCPRCGPRAEADALFCSSCGTSLASAAFCSACGSVLRAGSRFCSGCGTRTAA